MSETSQKRTRTFPSGAETRRNVLSETIGALYSKLCVHWEFLASAVLQLKQINALIIPNLFRTVDKNAVFIGSEGPVCYSDPSQSQ